MLNTQRIYAYDITFDFSQGKGHFPYESSVFEIDSELEWNPDVANLNEYPLTIVDDGSLIYYRYDIFLTEIIIFVSDNDEFI